MTLPASGQITLNQVNVELGNSGTAQIGMNDAAVRGLFGIASGEIEMSDGYGKSNVTWYGERGLFGGGVTGSQATNTIQYVTIDTTGNATDFGNLIENADGVSACSNGSRIVFAGGFWTNNFYGYQYARDYIQYVAAATTGNATDFGNLLDGRRDTGALSNGPRGVWAGGTQRNGYRLYTNVMQYITIDTTGNATDFGDLLSADTNTYWVRQTGCSNGTRGLFGGGGLFNSTNIIQYITIDTTGNATDFGDLTAARGGVGSANGGDRGVFAGGYIDISPYAGFNIIDYVSIPTTGNATDFGDLEANKWGIAASSDNSRAVIGGGGNNTIEYITIATTGNASDFGDLITSRCDEASAASGT